MKKILVVDDEPTLIATLRYNLEREGYEVFTAQDGESGLALGRQHHPDLVLLDLMLPGLDGLQVCRLLRLGLFKALEMFNGPNARAGTNVKKFVVILTDGDNTYNNASWGQNQPPVDCRPNTSPQNSDSNTGSDCSSAQRPR